MYEFDEVKFWHYVWYSDHMVQINIHVLRKCYFWVEREDFVIYSPIVSILLPSWTSWNVRENFQWVSQSMNRCIKKLASSSLRFVTVSHVGLHILSKTTDTKWPQHLNLNNFMTLLCVVSVSGVNQLTAYKYYITAWMND